MYDFAAQLREGQQGEQQLDAFFAHYYQIRPASHADQRRGIDRWFTHLQTGRQVSMEYKTDHTAGRTHNVFLETVSVDTPGRNKPGWVYTCQADYLCYWIPGEHLAYLVVPDTLRHFMRHYQHWARGRIVRIPNRGYRTHGYVLPQRVLESLAITVLDTTLIQEVHHDHA